MKAINAHSDQGAHIFRTYGEKWFLSYYIRWKLKLLVHFPHQENEETCEEAIIWLDTIFGTPFDLDAFFMWIFLCRVELVQLPIRLQLTQFDKHTQYECNVMLFSIFVFIAWHGTERLSKITKCLLTHIMTVTEWNDT